MLSFTHYTTLLLDAMCYHAAQLNYDSAMRCIPRIRQAESDFDNLLQQEIALLERHRNNLDKAYDEHERLAIAMEDQEYEIGLVYGLFLQHLAIVHVLCVTSLEAHITTRAKEALGGRFFGDFERIPLETKWLFLPKLLGVPGFDPGAEPFQSFSQLVKYRNKIIHYKARKEEWNRQGGVPSFLEKLGFTLKAAQNSLDSVKNMITELANQLKQEPPHWLLAEGGSYLGTEFELSYPDMHRS
jgi:hypothetical protein